MGIGAVLAGLGAVDAEPAWAADEVVVDDWADLFQLSVDSPATASIRLVASVASEGPFGLVVPPGGSWVLDLDGHELTIGPVMDAGISVEASAALTIRDSSVEATGRLVASGRSGGAGIGGGNMSAAGTVTIEGGTVRASGGGGGAGIGGGSGRGGGSVTVLGGSVTAIGSSDAGNRGAGIGAGALASTPGSLSIAGARLVGSTDLAGAECLAAPSFTGQPGLHARVDVSTTPECSVTVQLGSGELPQVTPTSLGAARVGEPFDALVAATGDPAPAFSVTAGSLPPGLTLHPATGRITGTPTTPGTFTAMVTAANQILGLPQAHSLSVSLTVAAAPPPQDPAGSDGPGDPGPGGDDPGAADPGGPGDGLAPGSLDDGTAPGGGDPAGDGSGGSNPAGEGSDGSGPGGSDGGTAPGASGPSDGGAGARGSDGRGAASVGSSGTRTWKAPAALASTGSEPAPLLATVLALLVGGVLTRVVVVARRHGWCASDRRHRAGTEAVP